MQRKSEFLEIKRIRSYFNVALGTTELAFTPDFLASVAALPSEYAQSSYQHFLATFGTHYTQTATMGGIVKTAISVDRCFSAEHDREEVVLQGSIVAQKVVRVSGEYSSSERELQEAFYKNSVISIIVSGGQTSKLCCNECTYDDWKQTILTAPVPVARTISPIDLIVSKIDSAKAEHIRTAIQAYISSHPISDEEKVDVRQAAERCTAMLNSTDFDSAPVTKQMIGVIWVGVLLSAAAAELLPL
jgi:hypothetical protein